MSHISMLRVQIKSLECLKRAARKLGLELKRDQTRFHTYQGDLNCAHALVIPGAQDVGYGRPYEIGVIKDGTSFTLAYDFYGRGRGRPLEERVGAGCGLLIQEYAAQVAEMEAADLIAQGWQLTRQVQPNGDLQLVLTQN
jgi:hypothetical protein